MKLPRRLLGLALFMLIPILVTGALEAQSTGKAESQTEAVRLFTNMLVAVEENYATKVDPEKAVYGAIDGMLRTLDPHSKFFDPRAFKSLREDQTGKYAGLGISVRTLFGKVTVVQPPFPDSPAEKVGLRVGDMITHVDGVTTQGLGIDEVVSKLKGQPNTSVKITISRPGVEQPLNITVVRQEIKKYTINHAYLVRPKVGYVKIDSFAETTGVELKDALKKLDSRSLEGLILDLRSNPGGLLTEAIRVSETFLQRNQIILKTGGRADGSKKEYPAGREAGSEPTYPLVVLLNQNSASASEIVAGAIQDHDRGLIVGETSFGKGLVQSVYTLRNNAGVDAGLALTTQKWYTPSGRLIQRDYSAISQFDYYNHRDAESKAPKEKKQSDSGRIVYGGGGITPDTIVETPKLNDFQDLLLNKRFAFFSFVQNFLSKNPAITASFQVTDAMLAEFKKHLADRRIEFTEKDFEDNKAFVKNRILFEIFYNRLGATEAQKVLNESDAQLLKALELLPDAKKLQERAPRITAEQR